MQNPDRLLKQMEFIREIDKLKYIQRKTKLFNSDRHENDAEHSWHLSMMVLVLSEYSNTPVDVFKVLKMLLIHDLVEIDSGDVFLFDQLKQHVNTQEELIAARRIFGLLPEDMAITFMEIWTEFEEGQSNEAKFAKAMDRLEPVLQNVSNQGGTWAEFNIPLETVMRKLMVIKEGSKEIWEYVEEIVNEKDFEQWTRNSGTELI